jgi:hypothetical protein
MDGLGGWIRELMRGRGLYEVGDRVRSRVDGLYGVVEKRQERRGVLIYMVKLDDPKRAGPLYGFLHEFEMVRADEDSHG